MNSDSKDRLGTLVSNNRLFRKLSRAQVKVQFAGYGIRGGETIYKWLRKFGNHRLINRTIRLETMDDKREEKQRMP